MLEISLRALSPGAGPHSRKGGGQTLAGSGEGGAGLVVDGKDSN